MFGFIVLVQHTHTQLHSFIIHHFLLLAFLGKGRLRFGSRLELNSHSRNMFMCVFILCLCRSRPLSFASRTLIDCKCASSSTYFFLYSSLFCSLVSLILFSLFHSHTSCERACFVCEPVVYVRAYYAMNALPLWFFTLCVWGLISCFRFRLRKRPLFSLSLYLHRFASIYK